MSEARQHASASLSSDVWVDEAESRSNLTRSQFLIWVGQSLAPDAPLYNMAFAYRIRGRLDIDRFRRAVATEVASNDALRTVVFLDSGAPRQRVLPSPPVALETVDLRGEPNPALSAERWMKQRAKRMFDLDRALYDTALLELGKDSFVWFVNQHHLVSDAWSSARFRDRVFSAYSTDAALPPQGSFADYAVRERRGRTAERLVPHREYWRSQLDGEVDILSFYGRSSAASNPDNTRVELPLGRARSEALSKQARSMGLLSQDLALFCMFATLLAGFSGHASGARRIPVGVPVHNRTDRFAKETPGLFVEVLPLVVELKEQDSFRTLARRIADAGLSMLRHTAAGVASPQTYRRSEVVLNFLNSPAGKFPGLTVQTEWIHPDSADADHKLRLQVHDLDDTGAFTLLFDFNCDAFGEAERELALAHFERLLDALVENPDQRLLGIDLVSTADHQARRLFNSTDAPPVADSIIDLFHRQVDATPDAVAVSEGDRTLAYSQLERRARSLAAELGALGVGRESLVPVVMGRSIEAVVGLLGVLEAGAAYLPLDPREPPARLDQILRDADGSCFGPVGTILVDVDVDVDVDADAGAFGHRGDRLTVDLDRLATVEPVPRRRRAGRDAAYVIYTSGSTGTPKGVVIEDSALANYLAWARSCYAGGGLDMALHSSLAVDLTVTSIYLPLIAGGRVRIYPPAGEAGEVPILDVFRDDAVDAVKLTPAHLELLREVPGRARRIRKLILGGEDLKTATVRGVLDRFPSGTRFYNEYGPTEATVGCMTHVFEETADRWTSVPIGSPIANTRIHLLSPSGHPVPRGVVGEICVAGAGLARGYLNRAEETAAAFVTLETTGEKVYRTGDLGRWTAEGRLEFLGRRDRQTKVRGVRIELGEVEAALETHSGVKSCVVERVARTGRLPVQYCSRCGIPSNHPDVQLDAGGVCGLCSAFAKRRAEAERYFKQKDDFRALVETMRSRRRGDHDCLVLFSGGKDSTYMLYQLVALGLKPLTFTLDNGFIADGAKDNVRRAVEQLGVDHVFGSTPHMNAIFADSLARYSNVCNGCFKTLYTLAVNLAREKKIPYIVTGLSRGQIFETRLHDLFRQQVFDVPTIEQRIADARKIYHRVDDAVSRTLDVSAFADDTVFSQVEFVDFYRYWDVGLDTVYAFLAERAPWVRPEDTGRSTNCLINDVGIHVHKKERGYHNYALPYSWDVRLGHKTRDEALDELDDTIDVRRVTDILREVGYAPRAEAGLDDDVQLVAYYTGENRNAAELKSHLAERLLPEMIPTHYVHLDAFPVTPAGKLDRRRLPDPRNGSADSDRVPPRNDLERRLADIWLQVLGHEHFGVTDNFFDLGGHSLPALQVIARVADAYDVELPIGTFFRAPTIADVAEAVEDLLIDEIDELSDDEVEGFVAGDS